MSHKKKDKRQRIPLYKYTKGGRASSVIALLSIIVFIVAIAIAIAKKGNAGIIVGILGVLSFIIAVAGFAIGLLSFKEETKFLRYSWVGTITNLVMWFMIFMIFLAFR